MATPEHADWIAHGLVARGAITEIDAKIKVGKTEFAVRLVAAILDGENFLDRPTKQTPVVYLTEQSVTTFREPLRRAGLLEREDLVVLSWHDTIGATWERVVLAAIAECERRSALLLVVDGFSQFANLGGDEENSSGKAAEAMRPLQVAAGLHSLGVVLLRHDRKSGGDVGDSARGSSAFGGAVDIILALRRGEGNTRPTIRALHGLSRYDETPSALMIELTSSGYVALGTESAVAQREARIALLDAAPRAQEHALTEDELLDLVKVPRSTARPALEELLRTGAIAAAVDDGGKPRKGHPRRFWRTTGPEIVSVATAGTSTESISDGRLAGECASTPAPEIHSVETSLLIDRQNFPAESATDGEGVPW